MTKSITSSVPPFTEWPVNLKCVEGRSHVWGPDQQDNPMCLQCGKTRNVFDRMLERYLRCLEVEEK